MFALLFALTASRSRRRIANSQTGKVTADIGINIRSGPGTQYSRITGAPYGATVTILGDGGNNFYKIQYGGYVGYASKDYIEVTSGSGSYTAYITADIGLNLRSGPGSNYGSIGVMPYSAQITVTGNAGNGWVSVSWNGKSGYCSSQFISTTKPGSSSGGSSGTVIRQYDSRFNSNIRNWGCAFMSCCWCGGINSIDGCTAQYNRAVANGWMRSDCYIYSWDGMKNIAGARSFRWASASEYPGSNQKEIFECSHSSYGTHFVVGNGHGGIEYDPGYPGIAQPNHCVSKRFFTY